MTDINTTRELLMQKFEKLLLNREDMSNLFNVSKATIDNYIKKNDSNVFPPFIKIGEKGSKGAIRWLVNDIAEFLCRQSMENPNDNPKNSI